MLLACQQIVNLFQLFRIIYDFWPSFQIHFRWTTQIKFNLATIFSTLSNSIIVHIFSHHKTIIKFRSSIYAPPINCVSILVFRLCNAHIVLSAHWILCVYLVSHLSIARLKNSNWDAIDGHNWWSVNNLKNNV